MTRYLGNLTVNYVTIASGQTTSGAIDLQGLCLCQVIVPAAFTGASISFSSSPNDSTYQALYNASNTLLSLTVTQGRSYNISPQDFAGCRYLKLVSASAEGADRVIGLVTREVV